MHRLLKDLRTLLLAVVLANGSRLSAQSPGGKDRPNILWIVSEDNTTLLGCYGDANARTPVIDKLAAEGVLFEQAFCNAPVCAPSRSTIITGVYANSLGTQHMRSNCPIPSRIKFFTSYLRAAGYYCSNNAKEDYNTGKPEDAWDESSRKATWEKRQSGQPFFSVFNFEISHEGKLHESDSATVTDQGKIVLPRYLPDTREMRHDWAQYYDRIATLDRMIGELLSTLTRQGLLEETIILYFADNGGVLPRSKRFLYEEGTHVPLIVRIPARYEHLFNVKRGARVRDVVSFVDLAPTVLHLAGIDIPEYMQGRPFLGRTASAPSDYVYMFRDRMDERYDLVRAVRDKRYRYIRNFMPHLPNGQHIEYLWQMPAMRSWWGLFVQNGLTEEQAAFFRERSREELYDIENDPDEVDNLAYDPRYAAVRKRMREALESWMVTICDTGLMPEAEMRRRTMGTTPYEYARISDQYNVAELLALRNPEADVDALKAEHLLRSRNSIVRYWGLCDVLAAKELPSIPCEQIALLLNDESPNVRMLAAEIVVDRFGESAGLRVLSDELNASSEYVRLYALNAIDRLGKKASGLMPLVREKLNDSSTYVRKVASYVVSRPDAD
jgi:arylsulfatase A-like enzyme